MPTVTGSSYKVMNSDSFDEDYTEEIKYLQDQIPEELSRQPDGRPISMSTRDREIHQRDNHNSIPPRKKYTSENKNASPQEYNTISQMTSSNGIEECSGSEWKDNERDGSFQNHHTVNNRDQLVRNGINNLAGYSNKYESNEDVCSPRDSVINTQQSYEYTDTFHPLRKELSLAEELAQSLIQNEEREDHINSPFGDEASENTKCSHKVNDDHRAKLFRSVNNNNDYTCDNAENKKIGSETRSAYSESDSIYERILNTVLPSSPKQKHEAINSIKQGNKIKDSPKRKIMPHLDLFNDESNLLESPNNKITDTSGDEASTPDVISESMYCGSSNSSSPDPIPEYSAAEEFENNRSWRTVQIGDKKHKIDLRVIEPYKKVLSHGGYYGDGFNAIIVFNGCHLPDKRRRDYQYVMDNLFLYIVSTLELLVVEDYMIVYFDGATPKDKIPGLLWMKRCYEMIDRKLKKNLKRLLIVHPTLWLKTIVLMTKPFISSKFYYKIEYVKSLKELTKLVPTEYVFVPEEVKLYDTVKNKIETPARHL